jgi:hypothetical protein
VLDYLFDEEFLVETCGSIATWDRLKRSLRTDGYLVANSKRFVVKRRLCKARDDGVDNRVWVYAIRAEAFEDKSPSDRLEPDKLQIRGNEGLKAHLERYFARECQWSDAEADDRISRRK